MTKRKSNVMIGKVVRVPKELTTDPNNRRGQMGTIVSADMDRGQMNIRFEDGIIGYYAFDCMEILKPANNLFEVLKDKASQLKSDDVTIIASVIKLAMRGDRELALQLAGINPVVSEFCITNTGNFYELQKNPLNVMQITTSNPRKAISYIRTSTSEDTGDSQKMAIEEYCAQRQIEIVASFKDIGQSGLNTDRNGLQDLLKYVEVHQGTISFVMVTGLDRISRSENEYMEFEERLTAMKIETIPTNHKSPLLTKFRKAALKRKNGL